MLVAEAFVITATTTIISVVSERMMVLVFVSLRFRVCLVAWEPDLANLLVFVLFLECNFLNQFNLYHSQCSQVLLQTYYYYYYYFF